MSMIAFFPWLRVEDDIAVDGVGILRYRRGVLPGGQNQQQVDSVMELYTVGAGRPVREATLVRLPNRETVFDDVRDDELDAIFEVGELVAFAGLAAREFFAPLNYANRSTFQLVVQAFTDPAAGITLRSRRRDGYSRTFSTRAAAAVREPNHVGGTSSARVDVGLLNALCAAQRRDEWDDIEEAIFFFNHANTDSPDVSEQAELVYTAGAFERLLGCRGGSEADLVARFSEAWRTPVSIVPSTCRRAYGSERRFENHSVAVTWLQDFYRHRGNVSHGRRRTEHPAIWGAHEHLLLSAFAFPLLVKMRLEDLGTYVQTDGDRTEVWAFEKLVCSPDLFAQIQVDGNGDELGEGPQQEGAGVPAGTRLVWRWNEVRREAQREALSFALWSQLNRAISGAEDSRGGEGS